ncbi:MAG: hypothetical protein EO766_17960, partial [Hydrotalea sp. AMD]|uniref:hypothetical protein n=1 Tax=Hydrotalea sp. AMD TaxID=2501297 RepID=UPI0010257B88
MEKEELLRQLGEKLAPEFRVLSISSVNFKPHPYTIGPAHIGYASDKYGGKLTEDCIREGEKQGKVHCATGNCYTPFDEHTSDKVCFVQLTRHLTKEEATAKL